jgi:transcriptional regulator with XRE-family HTH domain
MKKTIYSEEHKHLIEQLRKARKEAGLEQNEVAKLLSKTQSYISKIESGQRRIDLIQLREFAKVYKKPLHYFIPR